jgi:Tol biopolymer transport system component
VEGLNIRIAFLGAGAGRTESGTPNNNVYVMDTDRNGKTRLANVTNSGASEGSPIWSPDGDKIAFTRIPTDPTDEFFRNVYVMNPDGTGLTCLHTTPVEREEVAISAQAWSPDGKKIAFRDGRSVYVANAEGSGHTDLTRIVLNSEGGPPAWSPDGKKLSFVGWRRVEIDGPDGGSATVDNHIYVMNADGTGLARLVDTNAGVTAPQWSPDGEKLAFTRDCKIYVIKPDGTELTRFPGLGNACSVSPTWSPDGEKVAFRSASNAATYDLALMNADGTGLTRLTGEGQVTGPPIFSSDSKRMIFTEYCGSCGLGGIYNLYVIDDDGTDKTPLAYNVLTGRVLDLDSPYSWTDEGG